MAELNNQDSRRYSLSVIAVLALLASQLVTASDGDYPLTISTSDVAEINFYANRMVLTAASPSPEGLRKGAQVHLRAGSNNLSVTATILNWLQIRKLHSYTVKSYGVPYSNPQDTYLVIVVDIKTKDGKTHTFYADYANIFDESMGYRRLLSCEELERYFELLTWNTLDGDNREDLHQCSRLRSNPDFVGEGIAPK